MYDNIKNKRMDIFGGSEECGIQKEVIKLINMYLR